MTGQRSTEHVEATRNARRAFAEALLADYLGDPVPLVMAAYAEAFCDMLTACSESGSAAQLINLANSQLWPAGFQVTSLPGRAGLKNA